MFISLVHKVLSYLERFLIRWLNNFGCFHFELSVKTFQTLIEIYSSFNFVFVYHHRESTLAHKFIGHLSPLRSLK